MARLEPLADRIERTVDATPVDCARYSQPDNTVMLVEITAIAREAPDGANCAAYVKLALIKKQAGVVSLVGGIVNTILEVETNAAWVVAFAVVDQDLAVRVTGAAATTIDWHTFMDGHVVAVPV